MSGTAGDDAIAEFLTALHANGETAEALAGAIQAVRSRMLPFLVPPELRPLVDTCGTGGDRSGTFNISTATAIVLAACGVRVAKHGNRAASSTTGSADVLAALGVKIEIPQSLHETSLRACGITFLYAPSFHPALRHAASARKRLPFRTLFNLVGPLANPATPEYQLLGVPGDSVARLIASALQILNATDQNVPRRAQIVTGTDGLDELTLGGATRYWQLEPDQSEKAGTVSPADFQMAEFRDLHSLVVSGPEESAKIIRSILAGEPCPPRDIVIANAAFVLAKLTQTVPTLTDAVAVAAQAIDSGAAAGVLADWIRVTQES